MANNTVSKKDSGSSSSSHPGTNARPEAAAACKTPQCESWPTWCATCQALRAGEHICKNPDSAADEIAKPEPVYQRRLPYEAGTRRIWSNRGVIGRGNYPWIVGTSKNLTVSEVFYFELQVQLDDGSVKAGPKCHYFNIVTAAAASSMASSRSSGVSSSSSSRIPTTMTASGSGVQTAATATRDSNPAGGISTSAKIGLGVAIPAAALVGMLMGWAVFRNCRRENSNAEGASGTKSETSIRESQSEQGYDKHELPAAPRRTVKWIVKSELPG
ncbi:hypothetical protein PG995_011500 [Apiospora arundinis]